jgi:hypothetical protein
VIPARLHDGDRIGDQPVAVGRIGHALLAGGQLGVEEPHPESIPAERDQQRRLLDAGCRREQLDHRLRILVRVRPSARTSSRNTCTSSGSPSAKERAAT